MRCKKGIEGIDTRSFEILTPFPAPNNVSIEIFRHICNMFSFYHFHNLSQLLHFNFHLSFKSYVTILIICYSRVLEVYTFKNWCQTTKFSFEH